MSTDIPMIISVDDHVVEPPELWQRWLPAKHRERGPRVVQSPYEATPPLGWPFKMTSSGPIGDFWVYEDLQMAITGGLANRIVHLLRRGLPKQPGQSRRAHSLRNQALR